MNTIVAIDKPKGPTSHDIIDEIRKITGIRKVGHAGTLDPLASGVLVIGITRGGTKQMHELVKKEKEYTATIKLGETSTTDDEEGEKTEMKNPVSPDYSAIEAVLPTFIGKIKQIPPKYSAIKIKGRSAYSYARKGEEIELEARDVEIKDIEILEYTWPILKLRVETGSGVYIRSLARDIGKELETGGYLAELVRTRVGDYKLEDAFTLDQFAQEWKDNPLTQE
jgi:tRNA pseudouridine55 synthase